ncbi:hypothetical protein JOD43_000771 [Pullulanibacillus pueri]|uniref:Uncharacterized protein n=1 Tax=Pullulanibacillus pueri TaxID=1437324 RepID=A0A8J2ZXJ8_9BACL|nr:hypothetical protein [Pullulanibacillus pueri]MBM7680609.1 hypothetical protein [Pullulanibacillus pueri]GGH83950.1 hypothetical protein GCM10007096_25900 [Pullulanibacillus pueri]
MFHLIYNTQTFKLADREYVKLRECLPYWGLRLDQEHIIGAYPNKRFYIKGVSQEIVQDLNAILTHTGLSVGITEIKEQSDFTVSFPSSLPGPLQIKQDQLTYRLKPLEKLYPTEIKNIIHKKLWTPVMAPPIFIHIHAGQSQSQMTEWLVFLILSYLNPHLDSQRLSHISFSEYLHLVQKILVPINTTFAAFYKTDKQGDSWPSLPEAFPPYNPKYPQPLDTLNTGPRSEVKAPSHEDVDKEALDFKPSPAPFLKQQHSKAPEAINPFKSIKTANNKTVINPFKKKH